ncbi:MAG: transporter, partial [Alphaproteobacteria bacterium]|nr:transporter [Alphaproteobacteria bacterium]
MKYFNLLKTTVLATVLAVLVGCASTPSQEGTGEYFDDSWITTK